MSAGPGTTGASRGVARVLLCGLLAACVPALALATLCSPAGALLVRSGHGQTVSFQPVPGASAQGPSPLDSIFHNLDYNGGPVMPSNTNYTFYWDPSGAPSYPADYQPGIDRFFEDLAHDSGGAQNVDSVSGQYNDAAGEHAGYSSQFGGTIVDTNPYPAGGCSEVTSRCVADYQIQAELRSYLAAHNLPMDLQHEYFVLLPPGVETCFGTFNAYCSAGTVPHVRERFCAYHGITRIEGTPKVIVYANDPYLDGGQCDSGNHPNASTSDATISSLSHEHNESTTDPEPNTGWTDWASGSATGYEIGDKCRTFNPETEYGTPLGVAPDGASYNQLINGHEYWVQQEWSNQGHACLQHFTRSGEEPHASFTSSAGEEQATLDASASTAPGGVSSYEWQLNELENIPVQSSSPTLVCCKSRGVRWVALTVFAPDGASNGTARVVNVGGISLASVSKLKPARGPVSGGTTVTLTGTNFNGGGASVDFGGVPAASFSVASPTKIVALTPPGVSGTADVTVTTYFGTSAATAADHFKYGPPVIGAITPASGPRAGGTTLAVTGEGFAPGTSATTFRVGRTSAANVSCSSRATCQITTPAARAAGSADVVAVVARQPSARTAADLFNYE